MGNPVRNRVGTLGRGGHRMIHRMIDVASTCIGMCHRVVNGCATLPANTIIVSGITVYTAPVIAHSSSPVYHRSIAAASRTIHSIAGNSSPVYTRPAVGIVAGMISVSPGIRIHPVVPGIP